MISSTPLLVAAAAVVVFFLVAVTIMAGSLLVAALLALLLPSVLYLLSLLTLSVVDAAAKAVWAASLVSLWEWVRVCKEYKKNLPTQRQRPLALL